MNADIFEKVKKILVKTLNIIDENSVNAESKLKEELGLDSMSSLTFLMALEDGIRNFVIDPSTLETDDLKTVASITRYVELHINF